MKSIDTYKEIAIEFAKYLMEQKVSKIRSADETESYIPHEYSLMRGNLELHGSEMFDEFIDKV